MVCGWLYHVLIWFIEMNCKSGWNSVQLGSVRDNNQTNCWWRKVFWIIKEYWLTNDQVVNRTIPKAVILSTSNDCPFATIFRRSLFSLIFGHPGFKVGRIISAISHHVKMPDDNKTKRIIGIGHSSSHNNFPSLSPKLGVLRFQMECFISVLNS